MKGRKERKKAKMKMGPMLPQKAGPMKDRRTKRERQKLKRILEEALDAGIIL
jgi:CRISPR/Cas system CSM-associated protein Csm2 small subunit